VAWLGAGRLAWAAASSAAIASAVVRLALVVAPFSAGALSTVAITWAEAGLTACAGTFPRLCRLIPQGWVRELAYTGRRLPAEAAREIGLVNAVLPDADAAVAHALAVAREIAAKSPLAVAGSKVMINYAREHDTETALDYLRVWQAGMFPAADMAETFKARQEGREPDFPDLRPVHRGM
jgi:enoyl-CoA hydratase